MLLAKKRVGGGTVVLENISARKENEGEVIVPMSWLNMQLKWVQNSDSMTVDRGQRRSLFQTQCDIKGTACKLIIDSGSCTNGISRTLVESLGLSTWRYEKPYHLEWLNNCGQLKITHKVHVPFSVGQYIDVVECDVLPMDVCGLLLGRPWQYDHNAMHAGRTNTYTFVHEGKQRVLKPMEDKAIHSNMVLSVCKEKTRQTPRPRMVSFQEGEDYATHTSVLKAEITTSKKLIRDNSQKPIRDNSQKPRTVLIQGKEDDAACNTPSARVNLVVDTSTTCTMIINKGVQTNNVEVNNLMQLSKGIDGNLRILCGPSYDGTPSPREPMHGCATFRQPAFGHTANLTTRSQAAGWRPTHLRYYGHGPEKDTGWKRCVQGSNKLMSCNDETRFGQPFKRTIAEMHPRAFCISGDYYQYNKDLFSRKEPAALVMERERKTVAIKIKKQINTTTLVWRKKKRGDHVHE